MICTNFEVLGDLQAAGLSPVFLIERLKPTQTELLYHFKKSTIDIVGRQPSLLAEITEKGLG